MRGIILCEKSGLVREAFRRLGHDFYSCDLEPAEDGSDKHIQGDALKVALELGPWDFVGGHPPCTFLCNSSVHLLTCGRPQEANRWEEMRQAAYFFLSLWAIPCSKLYLENPIMHHHAADIIQVKYAQMVQPFQFGDPESKSTCLWLRGLGGLQIRTVQEADLFSEVLEKPKVGYWDNQTPSGNNKLGGKTAAADRARTYSGIADAMAEQWGRI
jgi:hypothetical protein